MKSEIKIVAEIGNTHEGSVGLAKQFIRKAAECGVDAVKFQAHLFDAESLPHAPNPPYFKDESRKDYFDRTGFTIDQWRTLKTFAEIEAKVEFICSPFSVEAADMMIEIGLSTYKIASGEVTNVPLLEVIAKTGRPVLLSSGMSTWEELDLAVDTLRSNGCGDLTVLQCTSEYPCPPEKTGLNLINEIRERYGTAVGFSDHTIGNAVPIAAVCFGATIIEKHFTLSKDMYGPDAKFSTTPDEMRRLVAAVRSVEKAIESVVDKNAAATTLGEMKYTFEKGIVAAKDLERGTKLERRHITCKKPAEGIPARFYLDMLGKTLKRDVKRDTSLQWDWLT